MLTVASRRALRHSRAAKLVAVGFFRPAQRNRGETYFRRVLFRLKRLALSTWNAALPCFEQRGRDVRAAIVELKREASVSRGPHGEVCRAVRILVDSQSEVVVLHCRQLPLELSSRIELITEMELLEDARFEAIGEMESLKEPSDSERRERQSHISARGRWKEAAGRAVTRSNEISRGSKERRATLILDGCGLADPDLRLAGCRLLRCSKLGHLVLRDNPIGTQGLKYLQDVDPSRWKLQELTVESSTPLPTEMLAALLILGLKLPAVRITGVRNFGTLKFAHDRGQRRWGTPSGKTDDAVRALQATNDVFDARGGRFGMKTWSGTDWRWFGAALSAARVSVAMLTDTGLNDVAAAKAFAEGISGSRYLTSIGKNGINLKDNKLGAEGWGAIFAAVCSSTDCNITSIDATGEGLGVEGAKAVGKALQDSVSRSLNVVDTRENGIYGQTAKELASAVLTSSSMVMFGEVPIKELRADALTTLDLKSKGLGPTEAIVLAGLLPVSRSLTAIDTRCNEIKGEGAEQLAAAVLGSSSMVTFGDVPIQELRADALTTLDLSSKQLGSTEALVLAGLFPVSRSLASVE